VRDALGRIETVLVLGGGSEIARATVRELLRQGPLQVILCGRNLAALEVGDLEQAGARVRTVELDALVPSQHPAAIDQAFAGGVDVDLALLAFGVLGKQEVSERDATAAFEVAATNFSGAVSVLTLVAQRMRAQGHGTLVVLSSVAAQRARRSNYVYGASKAGLDAFTQGLQLVSHADGVNVVIVRPGFVRTKMTAGLRPVPLSVSPEQVATALLAGLQRGADTIWVPRALRFVMWVIRLLPRKLMERL
jgi:decaprenylphospho-beta-D-erythro-pentofuranosid-2-ulose 2-reductase